METILINNQHVYYQVSGSSSCPSSAITMWLICQNLSGQLAGETMGTSLHRDWRANSRDSFMETGALEHKPWKTARNISCNGSRTAWNQAAILMCTIWKLNAAAELVPPVEPRMENQHTPYDRSAPGATIRHMTQEATKCREKFLTGQNVERLQRLPIAFHRTCWINHSERSKRHPDIHKPLLRSCSAMVFKAPGWVSRHFFHAWKSKSRVHPMVRLQWIKPCGRTRLQCCTLEPATISGLGSAWKATASNHKNTG